MSSISTISTATTHETHKLIDSITIRKKEENGVKERCKDEGSLIFSLTNATIQKPSGELKTSVAFDGRSQTAGRNCRFIRLIYVRVHLFQLNRDPRYCYNDV